MDKSPYVEGGGKGMFTNIVLAYDGSEYSQKALQRARVIAERFEATLWLVHVFRNPSDLLGYTDYEKHPIKDHYPYYGPYRCFTLKSGVLCRRRPRTCLRQHRRVKSQVVGNQDSVD